MQRRRGARRILGGLRALFRRTPAASGAECDCLARLDEHRRALDAVGRLPEPYRSTAVLCWMDGLAPGEIARRMGVSTATVEARLREAIRLLGGRPRRAG